MRLSFPVIVMVVLTCQVAVGDVITLSAVADTTLNELGPNTNMGSYSDVLVGTVGFYGNFTHRRILFRFDITNNIPAGSTILSADLDLITVIVDRPPCNGPPVFRVLDEDHTDAVAAEGITIRIEASTSPERDGRHGVSHADTVLSRIMNNEAVQRGRRVHRARG